jgi:hypothetical protein
MGQAGSWFGPQPDKLGKTNTLKGLQNRLQEAVTLKPKSADVVSRGLIVGGELTKQKVKDVPFRGRVLVSSIQLRYYKPQSRGLIVGGELTKQKVKANSRNKR